jgi:DNA polymerase/3'-5' exonuclease PolX
MDTAGRILKRENSVNKISLHGLSAGTYLITIKTEDNIYHHLEIKL